MSTPELTFRSGDLEVTVGPSGFPVRVGSADGRQEFLRPQREPGRMIIDGEPQRWDFAGLITDVDETEARYAAADRPELEYTIRNTFAGRWLQRHMLTNTSSGPVTIDDLILELEPGAGCVGWTWAASAETSWAVQPADGSGPVLAGELTQGALSGRRESGGFRTGGMLLPAGRRLVLQWQIDLVGRPAVVAGRSLPSQPTELAVNEPYLVEDPDVAVLVEDPVAVRAEDSGQSVISPRPGRYPIELRSARGTNRIDLSWVPAADDLVGGLSEHWLRGDRSSAGVALLPGGGAGLAVQQAFIARFGDTGTDVEDTLAVHTARLLDQPDLSIMDLAFLAQETVRTGDRDPLRAATTALLDLTGPVAGLGLAATRLCLAELTAGGDPSAVLRRLRELTDRLDAPGVQAGSDHLLGAAVALEMITVTGPPGGGATATVLPYALAVGAELGAGLPGHRLGRIRPSVAVYAAAVLDLLPEALGPELEEHWAASPHQLAQRTRNAALAEVLWPQRDASEPDGPDEVELSEVVGWLVLGRPVE